LFAREADYLRGHLEVAARKDFAAVQSTMRVDGLNMKGVFTRAPAQDGGVRLARVLGIGVDTAHDRDEKE
jgi:hypothetical protein